MRIEIGLRRSNRPGRAHAARQSERGRSSDDQAIETRGATRTGAIPQSETALVLHRLWLTNGILHLSEPRIRQA